MLEVEKKDQHSSNEEKQELISDSNIKENNQYGTLDKPESLSEPEPTNVQKTTLSETENTQSPQPDDAEDEPEVANLEQQEVPDLTFSREQTPDTDYYDDDTASVYSEQRNSQTPQPEERSSKRSGNGILETDKAVKRIRSDTVLLNPSGDNAETDPEYDPENPAGVRQVKVRRRVAAKVVDKLWVPLDSASLQSFENLCHISLNKVLERYHGTANQQTKVEETQRVITNNWLSSRNPKSFLARLYVSKLPPLKSLQVRMKGVKNDGHDSLNIDLVLRRKKVSEAFLLAELEQLSSLEAYYKTLSTMHELDAKYLHDFKKTTATLRAQHVEEKAVKMAQLHLDSLEAVHEDIALTNRPTPASAVGSKFDPNKDDDVRELLEILDTKITGENLPTQNLLELCDQLDTIYSKLNSAKFSTKRNV